MLLGASHRDQEFTFELAMTMHVSSEAMSATAQAKIRMETLHAPGGEMPDPPKPTAGPSPGPPPAPGPTPKPPTPK
jgi:hypothetical protein